MISGLLLALLCSFSHLLEIFTPEKNLEMPKLSQMAVNPTTKEIAYIKTQFNLAQNKKTFTLVFCQADGTEEKAIELECNGAHDLSWTVDDSVVSFIKEDNDGKSVVVLCTKDAEPKTAYTFDLPIDSVRWSAAGPYFIFSTEVYPGKTIAETVEEDKQRAAKPSKAMIFEQTFIRHWDTWETGKYRHVMYMKVTKNDATHDITFDGTIHDVMKDFTGNCPSKPWGGIEEYSVDPKGQYIAFCTQTGTNQAFNLQKNIYLAQIVADDAEQPEPQRLTFGSVGRNDCPIFVSLDGTDDWTHIFYRTTHIANYEADQTYVGTYSRDTGFVRELQIVTENSYSSFTWSASLPNTLFAISNRRGKELLVMIDILNEREITETSGVARSYPPKGSCLSFSLIPNGDTVDVIAMKSSYTKPSEIYLWTYSSYATGATPTETQLTHLSDDVLSKCFPLKEPENLYYTGANGDTIHGFYFAPLDIADADDVSPHHSSFRHPLVMYIHGGPEGSWADSWSDRWNPQLVVNQGFALFAPKFHGGDSYGQWFTESIIGNWGTLPYEDILSGLAYVLSLKADQIDPNRVAAMGASYGGYMMNWLQTHTNVFKAIVCHDGIFDLHSQYSETDELYSFETPLRGAPWQSELFKTYSPSYYCQSDEFTQTPQLIIHGGTDFRCVLSQGIQAFQTLQAKGVPSRLIYFPYENHWVLNPQNSQRWHQEVFGWLKNYV